VYFGVWKWICFCNLFAHFCEHKGGLVLCGVGDTSVKMGLVILCLVIWDVDSTSNYCDFGLVVQSRTMRGN
jgi:hypothetical protein